MASVSWRCLGLSGMCTGRLDDFHKILTWARERGPVDVAQWRRSAKLRIDTVEVCLQPWREPTLHGTTTDTTEM